MHVQATFVEATSSTKNASRSRDPEIHQAMKGSNWYSTASCHRRVRRR